MNMEGIRALAFLDRDAGASAVRIAANDGALHGWQYDPKSATLLVDAANELERRVVGYRPAMAGAGGEVSEAGSQWRPGWIPEGHAQVSHDEGCHGRALAVLCGAALRTGGGLIDRAWDSLILNAALGIAHAQVGAQAEAGIVGLWTQSPSRRNTARPGGSVLNPGAMVLNDDVSSGNAIGLACAAMVLETGGQDHGWIGPVLRRAAGCVLRVLAIHTTGAGELRMPEAFGPGGEPVYERAHECGAYSHRALGYAGLVLCAAHAVGGREGDLRMAARIAATIDATRGSNGTWPHRFDASGRPVWVMAGAPFVLTHVPELGISFTDRAASVGATSPGDCAATIRRYLATVPAVA